MSGDSSDVVRDYLRTLWAVAAVDGYLSDEEQAVLLAVAKAHSLDDTEIVAEPGSKPWRNILEPAIRAALLQDILFVVYADDEVVAQERHIVTEITDDWATDPELIRSVDAAVRKRIEWIDATAAVFNAVN